MSGPEPCEPLIIQETDDADKEKIECYKLFWLATTPSISDIPGSQT